MKCCVCNKEKEEFLSRTDLCTDCSNELQLARNASGTASYRAIDVQELDLNGRFRQGDFYVYKFMRDEDILYIGKSKSLAYRLTQHLQGSPFNFLANKIEYMEFDSDVDMSIWELFLINKYKPAYNRYQPQGVSGLDLEEQWVEDRDLNESLSQIKFVRQYN